MNSKTTTKRGVSITSRIKAGRIATNHNQTAKGLRVTSRVKAGRISTNHNQAVARRAA